MIQTSKKSWNEQKKILSFKWLGYRFKRRINGAKTMRISWVRQSQSPVIKVNVVVPEMNSTVRVGLSTQLLSYTVVYTANILPSTMIRYDLCVHSNKGNDSRDN